MLRMSKMADYGAVILTTMAHEPERTRNTAEIGAVTCLPLPAVSKILKIFVREGLVVSLRGVKGGYTLSRPPAEISAAQILNAIDGPIGMTECSVTPGSCSRETGCPVRVNWQRVNRALLQALQQITLEQMIQPAAETVEASALRSRRPATRSVAGQGVVGESP